MAADGESLRTRAGDFDRAVIERDHTLAEDVLDDGYALVLVHPAPASVPRAQWLGMLDDYVVHSWDIREQVVEVEGGVGLVFSLVDMNATVMGEDRSGLFALSDTWVARDGTWRVWRRHSTPLTAGRMPGND